MMPPVCNEISTDQKKQISNSWSVEQFWAPISLHLKKNKIKSKPNKQNAKKKKCYKAEYFYCSKQYSNITIFKNLSSWEKLHI